MHADNGNESALPVMNIRFPFGGNSMINSFDSDPAMRQRDPCRRCAQSIRTPRHEFRPEDLIHNDR
jgi:hypothetical protein